MVQDEHVEAGLSRRTLIKRIGAGTAVVWAAPVVTNLASPAFAQTGYGRCSDCDQGAGFCANQPACGNDGNNPCACVTGPDVCGCHSCIFCDHASVTSCAADAQCPPGWVCALSCCSADANDFRCHPACGTDNPDACVGGAGAGAAGRATSITL